MTSTPAAVEFEQRAVRIARDVVAPAAAARPVGESVAPFVYEALGADGLMAMNVPTSLGGSGAGAEAYVRSVIAVARVCASTAVTMAVTNMVGEVVARFGTDAQRQLVCPALGRGRLGAFALSESDAGSDAGGLRTRAVEHESGYLINGSKQWISHGDSASHVVLWARTGAPGTRGLTCFLTTPSAPGYVVVRREQKLGLESSHTCALAFDSLYVPGDDRLGGLDGGFAIAMMALDGGRIGIAAQAIGIGERVLDALVQLDGVVPSRTLRDSVAEARSSLDSARALAFEAARRKTNGESFSMHAAMAKLTASETAVDIASRGAQLAIHGPSDLRATLTNALRDARVTMIYEGTSEIQRLVIARIALAKAS